MILNEYVDQKIFRTAYRQWVAAKDEQALISFHEAGFFRNYNGNESSMTK
tara:strand:+ start:681 stop:830 length:150 start_codon:yes stop_codon:yes gene_type:complete